MKLYHYRTVKRYALAFGGGIAAVALLGHALQLRGSRFCRVFGWHRWRVPEGANPVGAQKVCTRCGLVEIEWQMW